MAARPVDVSFGRPKRGQVRKIMYRITSGKTPVKQII